MVGVLRWDPRGQGLCRHLQKDGFGGLTVPLGPEDGSRADVAASDVWQGICSSAGSPAAGPGETLPGRARSCTEPVGMRCPHPNRATACEGESKAWISFNCPATWEGLWVPLKVDSALGQTFTSLPLLQRLPCSQRTLLSSYNSDIGDSKTGSMLKKKKETSTWFLLQRQADMHATWGWTWPLGRSPLHFVQGRDLLSYVCPGVEYPEIKGRRLSPGHSQERRWPNAVAFSHLSSRWNT